MKAPIEQLRSRYASCGQEHVFRFWDALDAAGRERLAHQAASIDVAALERIHGASRRLAAAGARQLAPPLVERLPEHGGSAEERAVARKRGEELLRDGRVAALVVAGGQGTRLGFDGPKGTYPLGPVSDRSLFEIHAQKLRGARRRHGAGIPWYVLTSAATDAPTREFFARHDHFGLPREDVFFFRQGMMPALDFEGRLILEERDRIFESPNGHGGTFSALADSGALEDMRRRGVSLLSYFQVDNPLAPPVDPVFLGLHALRGSEFSSKVIRKRDPMEKLGVFAVLDGRVGVVEYTEIDDAHRHARDADGELVYWAGSPAIHALEVEFAARIAAGADRLLPYHASAKKIPFVDAEGRRVQPSEPNGLKLERFLFDAVPLARRATLVEVDRDAEYAPVKNAEGGESPASARAALVDQYRSWLEAAGVAVPEGARVELDHSRMDGEQEVRESGIRDLGSAGIVVATGGA